MKKRLRLNKKTGRWEVILDEGGKEVRRQPTNQELSSLQQKCMKGLVAIADEKKRRRQKHNRTRCDLKLVAPAESA